MDTVNNYLYVSAAIFAIVAMAPIVRAVRMGFPDRLHRGAGVGIMGGVCDHWGARCLGYSVGVDSLNTVTGV